jgi:hypothetical protein
MVRADRMVQNQENYKTGTNEKQEYGKMLDETRRTGNRQTENTGINAQGLMGTMGYT